MSSYWALLPAAGIGSRVGADRPKQYLPLGDKLLIEHTIERLLAVEKIAGVCVVLGADDDYWPQLPARLRQRVLTAVGGTERCDSVLSGLEALAAEVAEDDWILVHDVARPCISVALVERLIDSIGDDDVGGILALPAADTVKYSEDQQRIVATRDRRQLWLAQTPQMFRWRMLYDALSRALQQQAVITDEASAIEWAGFQPLLVEGRSDNIKVTRPEDVALAAFFLQRD